MNPVRLFVERPVMTLLLMVGLIVFGLAAWSMLPVAALPEIEYPVISVQVGLPGASPQTMATSVAAPLERQFAALRGVDTVESFSGLGYSYVRIRFALDRNIDAAASDVQTAINNASGDLPKDLPAPPSYSKENPADRPIVVIAFTSPVMPLDKIDSYVDTMVVRRIASEPGVSRAFIADEQKRAVRIRLNPTALAARSLSPEDVRTAIQRATENRPKGSLEGGSSTMTLESNDQLFGAAEFQPLVVAYRNGAAVHLGDVADIIDGVENDKTTGWFNGVPAIVIGMNKRIGANTVAAVDGIRRSLEKMQAVLPPAIDLHYVTDRAETIRASLHDIETTMAITVALVVFVIFLFLRNFWATVIPSITIPLSFLATFVAMALAGFTLDNLSLMALTISVGFVVDDAIVVIENIVRHMEDGETPLAAAIEGGRQVAFTIISISLSLVAVFIPVFFMGGVVGRLFREFGATVSVAIIASAAVSLSVTPMLCGRLMRRPATPNGHRSTGVFYGPVLEFYRRSLLWVIRHRPLTLAAFFGTAALAVALYIYIPKSLFPPQDNGRIFGDALAPPDTPFATTATLIKQLAARVKTDRDVATVTSYVGNEAGENSGLVVINLKPRDSGRADVRTVLGRLRHAVADIEGIQLFMQPEPEIVTGVDNGHSEYLYQLIDPNRAELEAWLPRIEERLKQVPGLLDVSREQQSGQPSARVVVDRELAARMGIDSQAVDDTLYDAFGARRVSEIFTDATQYYAILQVDPRFQTSAKSLELIYVASRSGAQVPLATFAHIETSLADTVINHQDQFPAEQISFNLAPGLTIGDAVTRIHAMERALGTPPALQTSFQGAAREFEESLASQPWLLGAATLVVYIVLGILYESFLHPLTIISSLPSAGVGALLALLATSGNLDVMGLIGIILLIGIVKKNAIMMIDFAVKAERAGADPEAAILDACLTRFRPIMMTTIAALFGALPLALGGGAGSELRHPLGIAIVGGLLVSQVLTLYTTPVVHLQLSLLARRRRPFPVVTPESSMGSGIAGSAPARPAMP